jgi:hypothetical protein
MLIDTDILIWLLRGNPKAVRAVGDVAVRNISVVTRMELVQGCRDRQEVILLKRFLNDYVVHVLPLTPEVGHRADTWMEEFALSHGVGLADCLIAATASQQGMTLFTANAKHFRCFPKLPVKRFAT